MDENTLKEQEEFNGPLVSLEKLIYLFFKNIFCATVSCTLLIDHKAVPSFACFVY
jgi:hypothetical protein